MILPRVIKKIIKVFEENSFEIAIVGGFVRDHYLGKKSFDIDLITNASLDDVIKLLKEFKVVNFKKGVMVIIKGGKFIIDITVMKGNNLLEDLEKRDFTINTLIYKKCKFSDNLNAIADLNNKLIRAVKNPDERFKEDPVRILRALRFKAVLNFEIEEETEKALFRNKLLLKTVSKERRTKELKLILESDAYFLIVSSYFEIFKVLFNNLTLKNIKLLGLVKRKTSNLLGALFYGCDNIDHILKEFTLEKNMKLKVLNLIKYLNFLKGDLKISLKKLLFETDYQFVLEFLEFQRAVYQLNLENDEIIEKCKALLKNIITSKECFSLSTLSVNGDDLLKLGLEPFQISTILEKTVLLVIEEKLSNNYDDLIDYLKKTKCHP